MIFEHIKIGELTEFVERTLKNRTFPLPITPQRSLSQSLNPAANADDTALIIAREENSIKGFIGILPSYLKGRKTERIYWNTCWWTDPTEGASVSLYLLKEFLKIAGNKVAFSDLSEKTSLIVKSLSFHVSEREGLILRLRSGIHERSLSFFVKRKYPFFIHLARMSGIFRLFDRVLDFIRPPKLHSKIAQNEDSFFHIDRDLPGDDFFQYIRSKKESYYTLPEKGQAKWWIENPWLVSPSREHLFVAKNYHFSAIADSFEFLFAQLKKNDEIRGVAILSFRDGVLKTPFIWVEDEPEKLFFHNIFAYCIENKRIHSIQTFHQGFVSFLNENHPPDNLLRVKRYTACSGLWDNDLIFQDGDGDYVFT